ncbi:MAG: N-acetylmuramoyl-L-alanine amidase, partial [Anaerolineae bacterium]|nr:N-acetylmuramoyl-L-alanine amidase [Anaerolineae bacterium]
MKFDKGILSIGLIVICVISLSRAVIRIRAAEERDGPVDQVEQYLAAAGLEVGTHIHKITFQGQEIVICLTGESSRVPQWTPQHIENISLQIRQALTPIDWQSLSVQAYDPNTEDCQPLSSYLPAPQLLAYEPEFRITLDDQRAQTEAQISGSLAGKTVYVSAGHGWKWTSYGWRTQRVVYEGFIEDHNNAEAVDQYLIPYLEQAGATVIPARERDWNTQRYIGDNDAGGSSYVETGTWTTSGSLGYNNSTYRYAISELGSATATAAWVINVGTQGQYAVYAWLKPGTNRVPDAHYTISYAGGQAEVVIDQRIGPATWRYLGSFPFYAGPVTITLDNHSESSAGKAVIADAIRLGGGAFDSLNGLYETSEFDSAPGSAPYEPMWETSAYYYSQFMGMDPHIWSYFNDVIARPLYARWNHVGAGEDAVYISWHSNGWRGITRGTESYVHNNDTCDRTVGSLELQTALHNELIHDIRIGWDADWIDRGKKQADLGEMRMLCDDDPGESDIPGVLFEVAFHDEPDDANALKNPQFNQLAARALYQGLVHYFENRDGINLTLLPEPPTHLRVENDVAGNLVVNWHASPTDGSGLLGESASAYRVYLSTDGFAWQPPVTIATTSFIISDLSPGDVVYVKVTGINAGGESFPTEILGGRVGEPQLLIVNGFDMLSRYGLVNEYDAKMQAYNLRMFVDRMNARNYVVDHGNAVGDFSGWDSTSNEAVVNGDDVLTDYDVIDWILGEESTLGDGSLSGVERAFIGAFLNSGGGLLLSGSDLGWDLEYIGLDPGFLHNHLHIDY